MQATEYFGEVPVFPPSLLQPERLFCPGENDASIALPGPDGQNCPALLNGQDQVQTFGGENNGPFW